MTTGLFSRIERLFDIGALADKRILIAGCGSGGGAVALQLAMSGFRRFTLLDHDTLDVENVIRHVCGLRYVGWRKVDALADVLLDRNPDLDINKVDSDLMDNADLETHVKDADVVVLATDNEPTRWRINGLCVANRTPFVVAKVFTRGIGGEVFAYWPGEGACLGCLEAQLERTQYRHGIREIELVSQEERDAIYGMDVAEIKDSPGLNIDISFITSLHARFVLEVIGRGLSERPKYLLPIEQNYLVWGNRPVAPFTRNFEIQRFFIHPTEGCRVCGSF